MPPARFAFLDHPTPIAFAHRGGAKEGPENTMTAFEAARDLGFGYLETDVRLSADGKVVILHDPVLDRVTDRRGAVSDLSWAEIAQARIAGRERIPLLEEALSAWPEIRWNIDAKDDAVVQPLLKLLGAAGAWDRVCLTSFFDRRVEAIRAAAPGACTGMGRAAITRLYLRSRTRLPQSLPGGGKVGDAGAAQVPLRSGPLTVPDRTFVAAAHRLGVAVHVWTVDDPGDVDRLLDAGVDGIMTDRPRMLQAALVRRGQWRPLSAQPESDDPLSR